MWATVWSIPVAGFRLLVALVWTGMCYLPLEIANLVLSPWPRQRAAAQAFALRVWSRVLLAVLGARLERSGARPRPPFVLVSNHLSYLDIPLLAETGLDATVVNIALPKIQEDLEFSYEGLAWVVNGYVLMAGGFLLLGGRLADMFGRRRVFLIGVLLFGVASAVCGKVRSDAGPSGFPSGFGVMKKRQARLPLAASYAET